MLIATTDWPHIEQLRATLSRCDGSSLEGAARAFADTFVTTFESIVLARVFAVLPFGELPAHERAFAERLAGGAGDPRLGPGTDVLTLLATRGVDPSWNDRTASRGHLAIPLIDKSFVQGAPMIAKLLSDLSLDLRGLDPGAPIVTRRLLGGQNGTFYVADAQEAQDEAGRDIIPARAFVSSQQIRTVFGMGGAYADGTLVVAIFFTRELLDRALVDRFPSLISNFKMVTAQAQTSGKVFAVS